MYFGTINYVHDLIKNNERAKARAFWEYCYDLELQTKENDYAWGVDESTTNAWLCDFYAAINSEIQSSKKNTTAHGEEL